jgi:hypothetical protein
MTAILTATGVKIGSKGRVANTPAKVGTLFAGMSKSDARKVRRALFAKGLRNLAAAPAIAEVEDVKKAA